MTGPLRVLMVITTLDTGGAEKHLLSLCEGLRRKGHAVDLLFLKGAGTLAPEFEHLDVAVEKVPLEVLFHLPSAAAALARRIRRGGYHVVHSHLLKADMLAALAHRLAGGSALVASKHNDERALLNPAFGVIHGLLSTRADAVIALSEHVARFVGRRGRVDRAKIRTIYYGVDGEALRDRAGDPERVRAELGLTPRVPVLTMVARFARQKDHPTLLEAARRLKDQGRAFRLLLAGDDPFGDHRRRMEERSAALGLEDRVTFLGLRRDVPALLAASDLFVMPTLWEGLGLVFLEAMAFALPVVSTTVSAVPEVVVHGETGILVPPRDPAALAGAIVRLLDRPEERVRLGKAGRSRLEERFGLARMIEETEGVYRACLDQRRGTP